MNYKFQRIFHPIGQGAFYSEQFFDENDEVVFTMVYDCGSLTSKNKIKPDLIKDAFNTETIDVLFISHFDKDHVNKIEELKSQYKILNVIMPLIEEDNKKIIIALNHSANNTGVIELLSDPYNYFAPNTRIRFVEPSNSGDSEYFSSPVSISALDDVSDCNLCNGIQLRPDHNLEWLYIPFNYLNEERREHLIAKLISQGIDVDKLGDVEYIHKKIKELRTVYRSLDGNINQNSLFLYSGPSDKCDLRSEVKSNCHCIFEEIFSNGLANNAGCVYTGDGDLNKVELSKVYTNFWNKVSTVQIPHHGSRCNFSSNFLSSRQYINCVISCGANKNNHPAYSVVKEIKTKDSIVKIVTEDIASLYYHSFKIEKYENDRMLVYRIDYGSIKIDNF